MTRDPFRKRILSLPCQPTSERTFFAVLRHPFCVTLQQLHHFLVSHQALNVAVSWHEILVIFVKTAMIGGCVRVRFKAEFQ